MLRRRSFSFCMDTQTAMPVTAVYLTGRRRFIKSTIWYCIQRAKYNHDGGRCRRSERSFKVLLNPGDEVIVFVSYFGEYRSYANNYGTIIEISPDTETFQPKLNEFESKITPHTKAVIVNTPNNPTGVVF